MPRKNENRKRIVTADKVVQMPLMPEHVDAIPSLLKNFGDIFTNVSELTREGYSINIMFDGEKNTYSVRLAAITEDMINAGHLLYGNGKTLELAFVSVYLKHFLIAKGGKWETTSQISLDVS